MYIPPPIPPPAHPPPGAASDTNPTYNTNTTPTDPNISTANDMNSKNFVSVANTQAFNQIPNFTDRSHDVSSNISNVTVNPNYIMSNVPPPDSIQDSVHSSNGGVTSYAHLSGGSFQNGYIPNGTLNRAMMPVPVSSNAFPTAPGTCTLPRRAVTKDVNPKVRSPSNPPVNRQTLPSRRPQQPIPPPRVESNSQSNTQEMHNMYNSQITSNNIPQSQVSSYNGHGVNGVPNTQQSNLYVSNLPSNIQQMPPMLQQSFPHIPSYFSQNDVRFSTNQGMNNNNNLINHSSIPNLNHPSQVSHLRDPDSGFDSMENSGPKSLNAISTNVENIQLSPSKSTENLFVSNSRSTQQRHEVQPQRLNFNQTSRECQSSSPTSSSQILPSDGVYPQPDDSSAQSKEIKPSMIGNNFDINQLPFELQKRYQEMLDTYLRGQKKFPEILQRNFVDIPGQEDVVSKFQDVIIPQINCESKREHFRFKQQNSVDNRVLPNTFSKPLDREQHLANEASQMNSNPVSYNSVQQNGAVSSNVNRPRANSLNSNMVSRPRFSRNFRENEATTLNRSSKVENLQSNELRMMVSHDGNAKSTGSNGQIATNNTNSSVDNGKHRALRVNCEDSESETENRLLRVEDQLDSHRTFNTNNRIPNSNETPMDYQRGAGCNDMNGHINHENGTMTPENSEVSENNLPSLPRNDRLTVRDFPSAYKRNDQETVRNIPAEVRSTLKITNKSVSEERQPPGSSLSWSEWTQQLQVRYR